MLLEIDWSKVLQWKSLLDVNGLIARRYGRVSDFMIVPTFTFVNCDPCFILRAHFEASFSILLNFTTVLANSADDKLMIFFIFPRKQDLTFRYVVC